jgi:RNA polymerase sigma-70 factor (ECF subfamily)
VRDADGFDEFYRESQQRVLEYAYMASARPLADAQDAVAEAYARAWQRWHTVRACADPEAWVRVVALRVVSSNGRTQRSRAAAARRHGPPGTLPDATSVRAHGDKRRTRRRATVATLTALFVVLGAATAAIAAPTAGGPSPTANSAPVVPPTTASAEPTVTSTRAPALPAPRNLRQGTFSHDAAPGVMAVGDGSVFAAFAPSPNPNEFPGEMVRIDSQTLEVMALWPITAHAVAVVVTSSYVWVASGNAGPSSGELSPLAPNEVQQFDLNGTPLHTYPMNSPVGLAADGDTVWVLYGPRFGLDAHAFLGHLHDGVADPPTTLSGGTDPTGMRRPLVVCSDGVYAGTYGSASTALVVDHIQKGRIVDHVSPPPGTVNTVSVLTCGRSRGVLLVASGGMPATTGWQLFDGTTAVDPAMTLANSSLPISASSSIVWLRGDDGYSAIDKSLDLIDTPISPGAVGVSPPYSGYLTSVAAGGDDLWVLTCSYPPTNMCLVVDLAPH